MNKVKKTWGWEKWIENSDDYCMKLICCEEGRWSSEGKFHFHKNKLETFLVVDGVLMLEVILDEVAAFSGSSQSSLSSSRYTLNQFDSFRIERGVLHRFKALTPICYFVEASTFHDDEDSYRVEVEI